MTAVLGFGLALGLIGALLLYREARRYRQLVRLREASIAALHSANANLEAARRLNEAQAARMCAALASMSDGMMVLDPDLRLLQWNDRFAELAGVPAAILKPGLPIQDIVRVQAQAGEFGLMANAEAVAAEVARRIAVIRDFPVVGVFERLRPNGRTMELRRIKLPDGGMLSLYTDITARKQASAAEQATIAAEAAAIVQKRHFLAVVSHELRVPLDALMSGLALIDVTTLADRNRALVKTAQHAGSTLRDLVGDILDLSSMEAGRFVLRPAPFDPTALINDVCDLFRPAAAARGIVLRVAIGTDIPVRLQGDAGRLRQVVMNLVSNATKFSGSGTVTIAFTRLAAVEGGGQTPSYLIRITDPGPVIPPAQAAMLFQPFTRLDRSVAAGVPGTGLGLAICARLVGLMGGRIGLAAEGGGNRFWFTVKLTPPGSTGLPDWDEVSRRPMRRARLLLVEDVAANRLLTATLLRREGHRVDVAETGLIAVLLAATQVYDLIFMDIHMPGIDGREATRRIRALPASAGLVPIVALTGTSSEQELGHGPAPGMNAVLIKPVSLEALSTTLRRFVVPEAMQRPATPGATADPPLPSSDMLDTARITALSQGLAPGMFAGLLEQCLADIAQRLPALHTALAEGVKPGILGAAHALAGMAGSYGLAGFERRMRAIMTAAQSADPASAAALAAGAEDDLARARLEIRAFLRHLAA